MPSASGIGDGGSSGELVENADEGRVEQGVRAELGCRLGEIEQVAELSAGPDGRQQLGFVGVASVGQPVAAQDEWPQHDGAGGCRGGCTSGEEGGGPADDHATVCSVGDDLNTDWVDALRTARRELVAANRDRVMLTGPGAQGSELLGGVQSGDEVAGEGR